MKEACVYAAVLEIAKTASGKISSVNIQIKNSLCLFSQLRVIIKDHGLF